MNFTIHYREPEPVPTIERNFPRARKPWERHKFGMVKRHDRTAAHPQRKPRNLRGKRYYTPKSRW